uniref:Uncharacterized protein n=1 Tax=Mus musculus TaxID=10090 RepID=Q3V0C4_MOUSE|nr:unnamed protein product [Mus musculus]
MSSPSKEEEGGQRRHGNSVNPARNVCLGPGWVETSRSGNATHTFYFWLEVSSETLFTGCEPKVGGELSPSKELHPMLCSVGKLTPSLCFQLKTVKLTCRLTLNGLWPRSILALQASTHFSGCTKMHLGHSSGFVLNTPSPGRVLEKSLI